MRRLRQQYNDAEIEFCLDVRGIQSSNFALDYSVPIHESGL